LRRSLEVFFKPTDVKEEINEWRGEPPPIAKGRWKYHSGHGFHIKVCFRFRGEEHFAEFYSDRDYINLSPLVERINELIKDTGYQYYSPFYIDDYAYVMLSKEEVEKLKKERGWF